MKVAVPTRGNVVDDHFGHCESYNIYNIIGDGMINGVETKAERLELDGFYLSSLPVGIVQSQWHNYASIGMEVLKGYSIVLNYCKEYIGFKKNT